MNIRGAIFDLDGTLTDSMYIWLKAPVDLVRRYGGDPPEDLARDLRALGADAERVDETETDS